MSIIGLINTDDGTNKDLETTLGLFSVATSASPTMFSATTIRGAIAVVPDELPSSPTIGTLAVDSNDENMLKWWDGDEWRSASTTVEVSGGEGVGGGSGIGVGQTIALQQGLDEDFTIAVSGVLVSMTVTGDPLPDGLTLNEATGQITGVPTVFGTYYIDLEATFADATVGTGTVELVIAEAFPVTFTFDETQLQNIPEGVDVNGFELTYTPNPNALPTTWDIQGLSEIGLYLSQYWNDPNSRLIYGQPQNTGTYTVTVNATNWTGTTTKTFDITVFSYNMQVYGTSSYDGVYVPVDTGYYTYDNSNVTMMYGQPSTWSYSVRIYEYEYNSNIKLFFFEPYAAWVIEDTNNFSGLFAPTYVRPMGDSFSSYTLPPESAWFDPNPYSSVTVTYIEPNNNNEYS
jgi:hypothetical protein